MNRPEHDIDLEAGTFLLARYAYPSLDANVYERRLDDMACELRGQIGSRVSGEETVMETQSNAAPSSPMASRASVRAADEAVSLG